MTARKIDDMSAFRPGLVHAPVTPFRSDNAIDFDCFGRLLDFHVRHGADSLALPMHAGEAVSLADEEKRKLLAFAIRHVAGRVPVIAHASDSGTAIAAAFATYAEATGAAAVVAGTPYYWTPPAAMLVEHFVQIGAAVKIPYYVHNAPHDTAGTKVTTEIALRIADRLENFAGLVDSGLDWQFMIELVSQARRTHPEFQLVSGTEHMVSAGAIGADAMVSTLAGVAPRTVRTLYDLCRSQKFVAARPAQEDTAALRQAIRPGDIAGLKAALAMMERDAGVPREPLAALAPDRQAGLAAALAALSMLKDEPRGWAN